MSEPVTATEIERMRADLDGWRKAHTLCLEAIDRLAVERIALRAIVSDLAAIPMHRDISPTIGALIGRARETIKGVS